MKTDVTLVGGVRGTPDAWLRDVFEPLRHVLSDCQRRGGNRAVIDAHTIALTEAMEYLAQHASYTRVHNSQTGKKDLVRLPGLVAIAYQHETSRAGDPHLHTHVIVPNRQPRADGKLVSIDGTSLYHEARAAGMIYQATLRRCGRRRDRPSGTVLSWKPCHPSYAGAHGVTRCCGSRISDLHLVEHGVSQARGVVT